MSTASSRVKDAGLVARGLEIYLSVEKGTKYAGGGILFAASLLILNSLFGDNKFEAELWKPVWLALMVALMTILTAILVNYTNNKFIRWSWYVCVFAFTSSLLLISPWGQSLMVWWKADSPANTTFSRIEKVLPADGTIVNLKLDSRKWIQGFTGKESGCVAMEALESGKKTGVALICEDDQKPQGKWPFSGGVIPATSKNADLIGDEFNLASMSGKQLDWYAKLK